MIYVLYSKHISLKKKEKKPMISLAQLPNQTTTKKLHEEGIILEMRPQS